MKAETKLIKTNFGLLQLAEKLGNVSQACKIMGYSRDSIYSIKELYIPEAILPSKRSVKKTIPKNRLVPAIEEAVQMAFEQPAFGQLRASNEIMQEKGLLAHLTSLSTAHYNP